MPHGLGGGDSDAEDDGSAAREGGGGADLEGHEVGGGGVGEDGAIAGCRLDDDDAGGWGREGDADVGRGNAAEVGEDDKEAITLIGVNRAVAVAAGDIVGDVAQEWHLANGRGKEISEVGAAGGAPTGAKVVAGNGIEEIGVDQVGVVAGCNVVEGGGVRLALRDGVDGGVDKADRGFAVFEGLFIDERGEGGPERRRGARATGRRTRAIVRDDEDVIGRKGDVGDIAHGSGPAVRGHVDTLLPGGH